MGKNVYLTENEQRALRDTASEWCQIMYTGDVESCDCVEKRLREGLDSALKKLCKCFDY